MKGIRSLLVSGVTFLVFLALAATGAKAQNLVSAHFTGNFTLPFTVHWGQMILPPGEYSLYYGVYSTAPAYLVEICGKAKGSPHGVILPMGRGDAKTEENALICVREGDSAFVRGLELPAVGESVRFVKPHGVSVESWITEKAQDHNLKSQLAEVRIPIERAPVK